MPHNYPLLLDVSDRLIVIVGGGEVAVRKAQGLIAAGAMRVRVVSPSVHEQMPASVERIAESYHREHLADAGLVFAATDEPAVNDVIVRDAKGMNILVCRADADDNNTGDFATPAMIRRGAVLVTVSTGGSPALAARLRDTIEREHRRAIYRDGRPDADTTPEDSRNRIARAIATQGDLSSACVG